MPSLKDLRIRISSVKSTQKITAAMKMVAASKLRRAQVAAEAGRPYADRLERILASVAASLPAGTGGPRLLAGTGADQTHLVIPITADRGLCGSFNSSIVRETRRRVNELLAQDKTVKILCVGRKGRDLLKRNFERQILGAHEQIMRRGVEFASARSIAEEIATRFQAGEFDVCTIIYNRFKSVLSQVVTPRTVIPFALPDVAAKAPAVADASRVMPIYEPSEEDILSELLPKNLSVQLFRAMLESFASEQGARMTAMDNATRNAGDMIENLSLRYNRTRQAMITKELIEIVSGAEAL